MSTANPQNEGMVAFALNPGPDMPSDWPTDSERYTWPPLSTSGLSVRCIKNTDKTLQVEVEGVLGQTVVFREPLPECDPTRLHLAIRWKDPEIDLILDGNLVRTLLVSEGGKREQETSDGG